MSDVLATARTSGIPGAIARYRIMSWVVGVMLLFLCVVAIPLQYGANKPELAHVGFTIHGIVYIIYLISAADMGRRTRLRLIEMVALVCAGFIPGLAFYIEHITYQRLVRQLGLGGGATATTAMAPSTATRTTAANGDGVPAQPDPDSRSAR